MDVESVEDSELLAGALGKNDVQWAGFIFLYKMVPLLLCFAYGNSLKSCVLHIYQFNSVIAPY
jgi:hypothetical protein